MNSNHIDPNYLRRVKQIARIKGLVYEAGLTFTSIERENGLSRGAAYDCLNRFPNGRVEIAIADALDLKVYDLFPDRYIKIGQRLSQVKCEPVRAVEQRRKSMRT